MFNTSHNNHLLSNNTTFSRFSDTTPIDHLSEHDLPLEQNIVGALRPTTPITMPADLRLDQTSRTELYQNILGTFFDNELNFRPLLLIPYRSNKNNYNNRPSIGNNISYC